MPIESSRRLPYRHLQSSVTYSHPRVDLSASSHVNYPIAISLSRPDLSCFTRLAMTAPMTMATFRPRLKIPCWLLFLVTPWLFQHGPALLLHPMVSVQIHEQIPCWLLFSRRILTTSTWPRYAALCNGPRPFLSATSMLAPFSSSILTILLLAVKCNGLFLTISISKFYIGSFFLVEFWLISTCSPLAAECNGLHPYLSATSIIIPCWADAIIKKPGIARPPTKRCYGFKVMRRIEEGRVWAYCQKVRRRE